ncbi:MAG: DUF423 domain-containing protein [Alphaproteobacteria bacterium]
MTKPTPSFNPLLCIGGLLGLSAIAFGAYAEHGLKQHISPESYHSVTIALQYQLLHAVMVTIMGIVRCLPLQLASYRRIVWSAWLLIIGICLFSFSIYGAALTGEDSLKKLAPLGGTILMLAWLMLIMAAMNWSRKKHE